MSDGFTDSIVEDATLAWLESLGYLIRSGPEIALGEFLVEQTDHRQVADRGG